MLRGCACALRKLQELHRKFPTFCYAEPKDLGGARLLNFRLLRGDDGGYNQLGLGTRCCSLCGGDFCFLIPMP